MGGAVGLGAGATLGTALPRGVLDAAGAAAADDGHVPFEGEHQSGITNHAPANALIAAFDVVATDRPELAGAMRDLTEAARWLTQGGPAPKRDPLLPPNDNLILGPDPLPNEPDRDRRRRRVAVRRPVRPGGDRSRSSSGRWSTSRTTRSIRPGPTATCCIQLCADEPDACVHALRILMRATRSTLVLRWMLPGFQRPNTMDKGRTNTRNLLGFKDGTANPDASGRRADGRAGLGAGRRSG